MIFHESRLLADDSHEILHLIFFRKSGKMMKNLSSAAVALRVKYRLDLCPYGIIMLSMCFFRVK